MARRRSKRKVKRGQPSQREDPHKESEDFHKAPHTIIIHRGNVGRNISMLREDFKQVFEPYTASRIKVLRSNALKDFIAIAGVFNVTHLVLFTKTKTATYLKFCRLPRGPTLTYRIEEYCLKSDVISSLKRPVSGEKLFLFQPFLVLNNFTGEGMHMKLMTTMFQNAFPSINVNKVNLNQVTRCVLFNYNSDSECIDFRHYAIKVVPYGINRGVKKIVQSRVPNLARFNDISELITKGATLSDSEAELDGPHNEVVLPQQIHTPGNIVSQKSAIRLTELGPRLSLKLIKIEEGLMKGEVLYHSLIKKSPDEIQHLKKRARKT